jgi:glycosyltransferase involved in cell wall biosynthesis
LKTLHVGKYFSPFRGGVENYMRDAMVALARRSVQSAALVHQHTLTFKTRHETFVSDGHQFSVTKTGMWARILFTPISPAFAWHLRCLSKTFKPDILHLHLPNPSVFWALALPSARRIPWVVHWHADVITSAQDWRMRFFYKIYQPFERAVLKKAKTIVVTSPPYRESSKPLQEWRAKCQVVPLGLDIQSFNEPTLNTKRPTTSDHPLRVLAIGRLTYYKGFNFLIEATAQAREVDLHLIGHGDQVDQLKALVASLNLQDRVTFHGILDDAELVQQMLQCDCLCLPSIERTEAFGMVLLEAMHFGKATVISDVPGSGMGWVVDDGITGIKVPPANADALAEAFRRLAANDEELLSMGQQGKNKFDQQFEINHAVEGLLEIYQQALD